MLHTKQTQVGEVVPGVVMSVQGRGFAYIDLGGGCSGRLHISQISTERISDVNDIFAVGDKIKVSLRAHKLQAQEAAQQTL